MSDKVLYPGRDEIVFLCSGRDKCKFRRNDNWECDIWDKDIEVPII